jgi:Do/DeqQ family serine protease
MNMNLAPRSPRPRGYYAGALVLVLIGLVIGLGLSASLDSKRTGPVQRSAVAATPIATSGNGSPFVSVVQRALPAVVLIEVKKKVGSGSDDPQDELFRRFFGDGQQRRQRVAPSSGSWFIFDDSGRILTSNHVVRDASDITVTLNDRRTFKAKVVGTDPETDIAVIQITGDPDGLPTLTLGDSDGLQVGDWAIAIGNPLGQLRGSVTVGIISATGRTDLNIYGGTPIYQDFIQTDASINFGNSGGPLCNIQGEVIGINTAINPGGQGIGFAIPINLAKHVAEQLVANGTVKRAWMGIVPAELTPELAEGFGVRDVRGILVQNVVDGTPADQAGLKRNDVILEFDGHPVADVTKFRLKVADTQIGKRVPMTVLRDGRKMTLTVTLSERDNTVALNAPREPQSESEAVAGLTVRPLTEEDRANLKVESGVVVTEVRDGSPADDAGIVPGDVVEEVGGKPVSSPTEFSRLLKDAKSNKKHVALLVNHQGNTSFVPLRIE